MAHASALRASTFASLSLVHRRRFCRIGRSDAHQPAYDRKRLRVSAALVLVPIGDGSCDHLDDQNIPLPAEIELSTGLFEVGREPPADIVVSVPTVSTRHAMLRLENDKLSITDLNSTNGTYIDDEELVPMRAMEISTGAEVTFGDMFLAKFKLEDRDTGK